MFNAVRQATTGSHDDGLFIRECDRRLNPEAIRNPRSHTKLTFFWGISKQNSGIRK